MDSLQNLTTAISDTSTQNENESERKADWRHDAWVDFRALNGTVIQYDEDSGNEKIGKMKIGDLADKLGVTRQTLYDWEKTIPDFWGRVYTRKKELGGQRRLSVIEDKWFLKALEMKNWPITEAWLRHYKPDYKESKQKVEHEVGNSMAELLRQLDADKKGAQHVIEAQVTTGEPDQTNH